MIASRISMTVAQPRGSDSEGLVTFNHELGSWNNKQSCIQDLRERLGTWGGDL